MTQPQSAAISPDPNVAIIGGGPAGLMAAEVLSQAGIQVDLYDVMPSVGRKLLLAGIGGLNITHSEDYKKFCNRYGAEQRLLQPSLDRFTPDHLRSWVHALGIDTFVGTSGRVFPKEMKAAPLLRAWLHRLRQNGVRFHVRHRWLGWSADGGLQLTGPGGDIRIKPEATILALGGASWPKLGSDGAWVSLLKAQGINPAPLQSANCGFETPWSALLKQKFSGEPLKSITISFADHAGVTHQRQGECIISREGIEGSLIYALSRPLRETINHMGSATFSIDLAPERTPEKILDALCRRGSKSLSSYLKSALGFTSVKTALLYEVLGKEQINDLKTLVATIKALPITVHATRPIAEAISSAGGVCFSDVDQAFMIKKLPGVFVAGEMLDWEAPTGGYLLTACLATGLQAGHGVLNWFTAQAQPQPLA
ncbi:MAG: NAD(P)/FAD-dependent oxidoreductase [Fluviibacter sp.]